MFSSIDFITIHIYENLKKLVATRTILIKYIFLFLNINSFSTQHPEEEDARVT